MESELFAPSDAGLHASICRIMQLDSYQPDLRTAVARHRNTPNALLPLTPESLPKHVGIIMDGNGRWAKSRFLPRSEGHRAGVKTARMVLKECKRLGIPYLTVYAFSSENWQRPKEEVSLLMSLLERYLRNELKSSLENDIRIRVIGDHSRLPAVLQALVKEAEEATRHCQSVTVCMAISYGGRQEILDACRKLITQATAGSLTADQLCEDDISRNLYAPDVPDPDLIIRTSNEFRTSNFLLWQSAYAEYVFTPTLWPDFSAADFEACIRDYAGRSRRYGKTESQVKGE